MKIVFFCIPAHGHTNPTLGVVKELVKNNHEVYYYSYEVMREKIESGNKLDTIIMMEPSDFLYTNNQQETMTLPQLDEFIDKQTLRGAAGVSTFEVEYHKRFAMPFAAFILTIIGVSLSCEKRKGGMGASIGVGLALSFSYILFL